MPSFDQNRETLFEIYNKARSLQEFSQFEPWAKEKLGIVDAEVEAEKEEKAESAPKKKSKKDS